MHDLLVQHYDESIYVVLWIYYDLFENFETSSSFLEMHKISSKLDLSWEEYGELRWLICMSGWFGVGVGTVLVRGSLDIDTGERDRDQVCP